MMHNNSFEIEGQLVDLHQERIYPARIRVHQGRIQSIQPLTETQSRAFILPGFVDAHVHVESSMLIPSEFARMALRHGTLATVSDPHEIANVLGMKGVEFMMDNGAKVPFRFCFGAPSCVPATHFETAGAALNVDEVARLLDRPEVLYLSEMMNFPGVLNKDPEVMAKIKAAHDRNKPVDGHAPGLRGQEAKAYAAAGIHTDHECFTLEEASDKLEAGMWIQIREGSAARNFEALWPLLKTHPEKCMLCSDDKHPDSLVLGHINALVKRALTKGVPLFNALKAACLNPVKHYNIPLGLLREGDSADFIQVASLEDFKVTGAWLEGRKIMGDNALPWPDVQETPINNFFAFDLKPEDFKVPVKNPKAALRVILPEDGQLITREAHMVSTPQEGHWEASPEQGLWKLAVVNRYRQAEPAVAFIGGLGIRCGALAASVAHDSHNIVVAGTNDSDMHAAVELLKQHQGGLALACGAQSMVIPLPFGGLMTDTNGDRIAHEYEAMNEVLKQWGCTLEAPFMTLSFMALLVIPDLKLSDKGLFDGKEFRFTSLELG